MKDRTAVLIHGCHLQANQNGASWEDIVWGLNLNDQPTLNGRGTMGLKVAVDYDAELIIFSTGASERNGTKEGEYTRDWALVHCGQLASAIGASLGTVPEYLHQMICERGVLDLESQNTREECEQNFRLCAARGIDRVILVSSPWHIQRSHTEALKVAQAMRDAGETVPEIVAVSSYGPTEGIVILEPPHRGDMPKTIWHRLGLRFFRVPEGEREAVERGLDTLLKEHGA